MKCKKWFGGFQGDLELPLHFVLAVEVFSIIIFLVLLA